MSDPSSHFDASAQACYEQIRRLFTAALDIEPGDREQWVRCQEELDAEGQKQLLAMLRADDGADDDAQLPQLENYELIEEIARGGMGVVYKARQIRPKRLVAIKMIRAGSFASQAEIDRFFIEAEAAAQLDDEAVVPVYELGTTGGEPFIAMKYVDGPSLESLLEQDGISTTGRNQYTCHRVPSDGWGASARHRPS